MKNSDYYCFVVMQKDVEPDNIRFISHTSHLERGRQL